MGIIQISKSASKKKKGVKKDRPHRSTPNSPEEKDLPVSIDNDEDNEPLAKRRLRFFNQGGFPQKTSSETPDGNLSKENTPHETTDSRVSDARPLSVALVQHQEWEFDRQVSYATLFFGHPDFLSMQDPESERIWEYLEQLQYTEPLQTVMPTTPSCKAPRPASNRNSPGMTQMKKNPTQYTPIKETVLQKRNLVSFREVLSLSYVGLGPQFGTDSRYFDKVAASKRKWGRIIEDIAKVSMPPYERTDKGLTCFYPSVPKQHNGLVENGILQTFQKEIILDIVMGLHNSVIEKALDALDSHPCQCLLRSSANFDSEENFRVRKKLLKVTRSNLIEKAVVQVFEGTSGIDNKLQLCNLLERESGVLCILRNAILNEKDAIKPSESSGTYAATVITQLGLCIPKGKLLSHIMATFNVSVLEDDVLTPSKKNIAARYCVNSVV
ncbi:hypothetical protein AHAS_Ahas13G0253600 [Arachis hypogaea]